MKDVLLIFKTHLDIGFTDYSKNVMEQYLQNYIPNAIKVGYQLKNTDTPFVWTVGSFLVWEALKHDEDKSVENAIKDGILRWHALPFTTHTELMSEKLFELGLSLSKKLDERFGMKTTGAKMTDVPGHTLGMIPICKRNCIKFLHIGVNPATPLPSVPPIFRWRYNGEDIIVMYQGDYGEVAQFDDFIVYFAHTGDNLGPQDASSVVKVYQEIKEKYPDCNILASSIEDLARRIANIKDLPIIEKEIGDTWIHGAGTDPQKVSRFRRLMREIEGMDDIPDEAVCNMLSVAEHTWGMDVKTHFPYDKYYTHQEMQALKKERKKIEKSWQEQRDYVINAENALNVKQDYVVAEPNLSEYEKEDVPLSFAYEISWQLFDNVDYERYKKTYMRCFEPWAIWDFTKVGLEDYEGGIFTAKVVSAYSKDDEKLYKLEFESNDASKYGLPTFYLSEKGNNVEIKWFNKQPSRLPQAFWLKFKNFKEEWLVQKMGAWIKPENIIYSSLILGIDRGVKNQDVFIESLDAPLVAPYGRRLLQYNVQEKEQDLYFNLYNNIWNTNFPMWYEDDAIFRFKLNFIKN